MPLRSALPWALACVALASPPAHAAAIRPSLLLASPAEFPGLHVADAHRSVKSSPRRFASLATLSEDWRRLKAEHFKRGAQIDVEADAGLMISSAAVFMTRRDARLREREALRELGKLTRFSIAAIPGAVGLREVTAEPSGVGELVGWVVVFSTDRCTVELLVGLDSAIDPLTPRGLQERVVSSATVLYRRAHQHCG